MMNAFERITPLAPEGRLKDLRQIDTIDASRACLREEE